MSKNSFFLTAIAACSLLAGCGPSGSGAAGGTTSGTAGSPGGGGKFSGKVDIDGSSTVGPILQAVAEEFGNNNPDVRATVGISGTGGGFKKFSSGEIDIADASRPIEDKEVEACKAKGIEFIELPVAFDGLSVVVNPQNDFLEDITIAELKSIWSPDSKVTTWDQVRAGFPKEKIKLYGAGTDSGTFDYFTLAVNGKEKASRSDYQASEDDNTLVQGVAGDKYSLGYFGYAYFDQNKDKLKLLKVNGVAPSPETINDGTYQPLSRPLFIYVNKKSLEEKPQVKELVKMLLTSGKELIRTVGYVPLSDDDYKLVLERMEAGTTGTVFHGAQPGIKIKDVMSGKNGG